MGFRQHDWECSVCQEQFAALVWADHGTEPPREELLDCPACMRIVPCQRIISLVATYMGEKDWCPMVAGGSFDTMGQRPTRALPLPSDGVSSEPGALREHFRSPEWRDAKAQRVEQNADNAKRRKRAQLVKQGQSFNLRRSEDRVRGDPKI